MPSAPGMLCVQCRRRPVDARYRPFCSERCKLIDLGKWADGEYRAPGEPVEPEGPPEEGAPDS